MSSQAGKICLASEANLRYNVGDAKQSDFAPVPLRRFRALAPSLLEHQHLLIALIKAKHNTHGTCQPRYKEQQKTKSNRQK